MWQLSYPMSLPTITHTLIGNDSGKKSDLPNAQWLKEKAPGLESQPGVIGLPPKEE
jgi:hypothetical protein